MRRRSVLGGACLALSSLSGCNAITKFNSQNNTTERSPTHSTITEPGTDVDALDGYVRPDDEPQTIPNELSCDEEVFERRRGWIDEEDLHWGNLSDDEGGTVFALRVDSLTVERGADVTVTLTNVSNEVRQTGNIHKSNVDVYTDGGWQDPRGWSDGQPKPVTDDLWEWNPGQSHEVTFEMTEAGIIDGAFPHHRDELVTCPGLPPGRYRFGTAAPQQGDVAVAFDLIE